ALAALEEVLASNWEQAAIVSAEESVLEEMGLDRALRIERAPSRLSARPEPPLFSVSPEDAANFSETESAMTRLLQVTRRRVWKSIRDLLAGRSVEEAVNDRALSSQHARLMRVLLDVTRRTFVEMSGMSEAEFAAAIVQLREQAPVLTPLLPLLEASVSAYPR